MLPTTRIKPLPLALLLALGAPVALAQSAAKESVMPQVTVSGQTERADGPVQGYRATRSATFTKTDTPLKEVPASITVVPAELMKDQAMQSLADVLRYVPGATAHQGEGNRDQVVLRGISTTADFYVDGVRDDAQVFRDLYNLERVEVLKGPGGMMFGRGGAGGVVNRVTKKPQFGAVGEASVTVGSHSQLRGTLDVGNRLNDAAAWRIEAMKEQADSFRDGVKLKREAINPTLTLIPGAATTLTLGYEHLHDVRTADRGIPSKNGAPFDTATGTFFGNASLSTARSTIDGISVVLDHELGNGMQLKNSFRATHYDKFYQNIYPGSAVSAANTLSIAAYNNANQRTNVFNQTDLISKFVAGGFKHTLLAGIELGYQDSNSKRVSGSTAANISALAPLAPAPTFAQVASDANNNVKSNLAALYVQDQIELAAQWKLLAGLRQDSFKVKFHDTRSVTSVALPLTDLARTDKAWSPRLGLIWTPTAASTYYASYSYAFLPSGEQLSLATTTADLEPEKARNYEIGARWDLLPALSLSAAAFRLDRDDVRSADPNRAGFFVKSGQQRTEGFEFGLQGNVTRDWQIHAGYANLDARVTKALNSGTTATVASLLPAGNKVGLVPNHMLSVWNRLKLGQSWAVGVGVVHQSESFAATDNAVKLPAFTRADGAVYYAFADSKTTLAFNVENLFDKKYYPTVDGNNNISTGAPRTGRLTLTTQF